MRARNVNLSGLLIAGTLILTLVAGCGKRVGPVADPAEEPATPPVTTTPAPDPTTAPTTPPGVTPGLPGVPGQPSNPAQPGNPTMQLQAQVESVKNGSFLGMGAIVVKVKVTNPTQYALTGEVTVAFTNGGQATAEVASERVSLLPNESLFKYFENSKWSLDGATVTVKTDAPLAGANTNPYGY